MENVAALDSLFEFFGQGVVNPDDASLLSFADKVNLAKVKLDVFRFEVDEFGTPETCVDKASNDEVQFAVEKVTEFFQTLEEKLQFVWVEASGDSVFRFGE